ncbi:MAG: hypothetical protein GC208_10430 [Alphaproteobacteria bacterium]|nr:hypothetical protein [Alphaproteobacteria bacterium]
MEAQAVVDALRGFVGAKYGNLSLVARSAGVNHGALHRIASGAVSPRLDTLVKIEKALGELGAIPPGPPVADAPHGAFAETSLVSDSLANNEELIRVWLPTLAGWEIRELPAEELAAANEARHAVGLDVLQSVEPDGLPPTDRLIVARFPAESPFGQITPGAIPPPPKTDHERGLRRLAAQQAAAGAVGRVEEMRRSEFEARKAAGENVELVEGGMEVRA